MSALRHYATALGGEVSGGQILAPGPGHSPHDRSLAVRLDPSDPDASLVVHSFSNDDPMQCKDMVRDKLGLAAWRPSERGPDPLQRMNDRAAARAPRPYSDAGLIRDGFTLAAVYDYADGDELLYQVLRYEHATQPKTFRQRRPDGRGGWLAEAGDRRVPYRMADRQTVAHNLIWITEGEKDADRLASLGLVATTAASGKWTPEMAATLGGYECLILEDNDAPGREKAAKAAKTIRPYAESVLVVSLPGLPPGGDVSDWLDAGGDPATLVDVAKGNQKPERRSTFTATELWDMEFAPVAWIVPDYITAGLTLLVGAPKLGKSWLALDICNAVAQGGYTLGDRHCAQGAVLYCALEDNPRRIKDRLHKVCARKPAAGFTVWTEMQNLEAGGLEDLRAWIVAANTPRLIVIDVLNKVRAAQGKNEAPYQYDYRSVTPLKEMADEFGIAIVVIHHTRKADAGDKLEKVSGTNGLTGAADTTIILDRDGEGVTLSGRGRDIAEFEVALEFQKDNCRWSVLGDAGEVRKSDERKAILDALEGETTPMGPAAIASLSGLNANNVSFLLNRMGKAGEVQKVGYGKYLHPDISPPKTAKTAKTSGGEA